MGAIAPRSGVEVGFILASGRGREIRGRGANAAVHIPGCNPHRSLWRSLEPERERVGDRHEATRKGIRDPPLRDPGLPVEFEAGPDSPEILGRGLQGFFKRVGGSGDAARA